MSDDAPPTPATGRVRAGDAAAAIAARIPRVRTTSMGQVLSTRFRLMNFAYAILPVGLGATTTAYLIGHIV